MKTQMDLAIENEEDSRQSHINYFKVAESETNLKKLKTGIWVYFILWLIEGALRKWVFPSLATPLLIVRDPVAIWLLYIAWKNDTFPHNNYVFVLYTITIIGVITAVMVGHGSLLVALYGARIYLIHFPLVFVIGRAFDRSDVIKIGKVVLWLSIPIAILVYFQFNSPQKAFVNRGIGDNAEGGGFQGALGYFRPPGLFSFETGNIQFFFFVAAFVFYFLMNQKEVWRYVLFGASASLLIAIPLSISRTLVAQVGICVVFVISSIIRRPKYLGRLIGAIFVLLLAILLLSKSSFVETPIKALTTRFQEADSFEGGVGNTAMRLLADIDVPLRQLDFPFFGYGIGMGTNVGAKLLTGSSETFLVAEGEWGRVIGEMGIILGSLVLLIRFGVTYRVVVACYKKLIENDLLPWMLLSISLQSFTQAQWAQPATLGFSILAMGLTIASLNATESFEDEQETINYSLDSFSS
jgi:hypothetical protein